MIELIGNTPLIEIEPNLYAKCEFKNPGGSIKDRIALAMIEEALKKGLDPSTPIIEPTSGNTGIAIAMIAAAKGLKATIVMPESMSIERRKLIRHFGAEILLTPADQGMKGAIQKAQELIAQKGVMLDQFSNPANPAIHERTTAQEILRHLTPHIFVAGVGTGGTIMGVGRVLKPKGCAIVAVEPAKSAVLSGKEPGPHKIQGIGAGFIPPLVDKELFDEIIPIEDEEALQTARWLARSKGLMVGISAGANVAAAKKLQSQYPNKTIVTVLPDTAERYLSTELFG